MHLMHYKNKLRTKLLDIQIKGKYKKSHKHEFINILNSVDEMLGTALESQYDADFLKIKNDVKVCQICLGIIQLCDSEKFLSEIKSKVEESEYEFDSFKLNLNIPLSC
jgi:hypothetical protein